MCSINKYLTEKMIDYHIIEPEDIEIYTYGLTNGFIIIANILTTLLFACLIEKIDIAIIMLLSFIRKRLIFWYDKKIPDYFSVAGAP